MCPKEPPQGKVLLPQENGPEECPSPEPPNPELPLEGLADLYIVPEGEHPWYQHRCMICLDNQGHSSGVQLKVICPKSKLELVLTWEEEISDRMRNAINDLVDATEKSALAISFLIAPHCTGSEVVRQAKRKTGFDYFLSSKPEDDRLIFNPEHTARLEVSGILNGDKSKINSRFKEKFNRAEKKQAFSTMPICVCVIEHSAPSAEVRWRDA